MTDTETKAPIEGLGVCAHPSLEDGSLDGGCSTTDSNGEYTISLTPRSYTVVFEGPPLYYGRQWHDHRDNWWQKDTVVVASDPITGIDAEMKPFGQIEGTVREEGGGIPVEDTRVCAWEFEGNGSGRCTRTDANGDYAITKVPPDEYVIEFWPRSSNHLWQFYDHKEHWEEADPLSIGLTDVLTEIDADVPPAAGAEGVVTRADNGAPFVELFVNFWPLNKETFWPTRPNQDGSFSIDGMPPGDYKVEFLPYSSKWETEFWDDKASWEEAATLSLAAGTITTGIDAEMVLEQPSPQLTQVQPLSVPSLLPTPLFEFSPPQRVRRACPKGFRKKLRRGKVRCVRKHKRHHRRHQTMGLR